MDVLVILIERVIHYSDKDKHHVSVNCLVEINCNIGDASITGSSRLLKLFGTYICIHFATVLISRM